MAIEDSIERIASALERIAKAQEENTQINASYKAHLAKRTVETPSVADVVEEEPAVAPMDTADAPEGMKWTQPAEPEKELTFEELKAFLHVRGYDFPKGTKRTTLLKAWEAHKDEPVKEHEPSPVEPPPLDVNPAGYAPSLTAASPAPAPVAPAPMTREEAMKRIRANYSVTEEDKSDWECFAAALKFVGVDNFPSVPDEKLGDLVNKYEELKNARK